MTQRPLSLWEATEPAWPALMLGIYWFANSIVHVEGVFGATLLALASTLMIILPAAVFGPPAAPRTIHSVINPRLVPWGAALVILGGLASQLDGHWKHNGIGVVGIGACYIVVGGAAWLWNARKVPG